MTSPIFQNCLNVLHIFEKVEFNKPE